MSANRKYKRKRKPLKFECKWIWILFKRWIQKNKIVKLYTYNKLVTRPFPWPFLLGSSNPVNPVFSLEVVRSLGYASCSDYTSGENKGLTGFSMLILQLPRHRKTGLGNGLFTLLYVTIITYRGKKPELSRTYRTIFWHFSLPAELWRCSESSLRIRRLAGLALNVPV